MSSASAKTIDLTSASKSKVPSASVGSPVRVANKVLDPEVKKFRENRQELKKKSDVFSIIGSSLDKLLNIQISLNYGKKNIIK